MTYETTSAFRMALEQRLLNRSEESRVGLDRLRRRVLVERIVARLESAEPGRWVLKGGMALEVRLRDDARLTKDLDLGLRDDVHRAGDLHERLIDALGIDPGGDGFVFRAHPPVRLREDGGGHATWRVKVVAELADKRFGSVQLDISPREYELDTTDRVALPNSLDFAGISPAVIEIIDVNRHAAEKLHALTREFGDRANSRVRDLVDLVILIEHGLLDPVSVEAATRRVWSERDGIAPPVALPSLPESWPERYERLAADHDLESRTLAAAAHLVGGLWADMFTTKEI